MPSIKTDSREGKLPDRVHFLTVAGMTMESQAKGMAMPTKRNGYANQKETIGTKPKLQLISQGGKSKNSRGQL